MAKFRSKCVALVIFLTSVLLSCGFYLNFGFLDPGQVSAKLIAPVAEGEKHIFKAQNVTHRKGNLSVAELCQLPDVRHLAKRLGMNTNYRLFNNSKVCYCIVPKAASTSLLRSLLMAEYPEKSTKFKNMAGNNIHVQKELINSRSNSSACADGSEMSFFVTRNPYERLFSAYIDKVFLEKFPVIVKHVKFLKLSNGVVDNETKRYTQDKFPSCDVINATFEDFLYYVVTYGQRLDQHFVPITTLCNPCKHDFKFILNQEKLNEQYPQLTKYLNHGARERDEDIPVRNYSGMDGVQSTANTFYNLKLLTKRVNHCSSTVDGWNAINKRLWDALKMLGNIDKKLEFNVTFFDMSSGMKTGTEAAKMLVQNLQENGIQALPSDRREQQRREYLTQAYKNVSADIISQLQQLFKLDFLLFNYDINPPV